MRVRPSLLAAVLLASPFPPRADDGRTRPPDFLRGPVRHATYDGLADDLLTGGLGASGLQAVAPPPFADALHPTAAELRTRAIYNNYRALVDMTTAGGYGVLYGPTVVVNALEPMLEGGKIPGDEFLAYADDGTGRVNVTLMVQVPASFDRRRACIVTATSSGSRGVYGAIATAGEWGLKHGCAVAYVDKGTGNGAHDLQANTVGLVDGTRADADAAGAASSFTAPLSAAERTAFVEASPNRFAFKHAHSQQNPERDWGRNTLQAIRFAYFVLDALVPGNEGEGLGHGRRLSPRNTVVIASSVSNGGGAALAAAEEDEDGLVSGVVAGEPQVQPRVEGGLAIRRGASLVPAVGRPLLDYFTAANLLQPCATRSAALAASPGLAFVSATAAAGRCAALAAAGVLQGTTLADQADEALALLHGYGYEPGSDVLHASLYAFATPAIAVTYANSYGRFPVTRSLCGFSFAATGPTGAPTAIAPAAVAQIFASGNGIPPTGGVNIVNDHSVGGPLLDGASISPGDLRDLNAPGALCLRSLATGTDASGAPLSGQALSDSAAVRLGVSEVLRSGDLHGKPALVVHGRDDGLVPVNHASRAYFGMNRIAEGAGSRLSYLEVTNAQHFDSFIGSPFLPGYANRFVPLHKYFLEAMDLMYAHLTSGAPLPPSQVVRTVPRGGSPGAAPAIGPANVPPIPLAPAPGDRIGFSGGTVLVPD